MQTVNLFVAVATGVFAVIHLAMAALVVKLVFAVLQDRVPGFWRAVLSVIAAAVVSFGILGFLVLAMRFSRPQMTRDQFTTLMLFLPLAVLVLSALASAMTYAVVLATTYRRGLGIWFLQALLNGFLSLVMYGGFYLATGAKLPPVRFTQLLQ